MNPELRRILQIVLDRQVGCPYTPRVCEDCAGPDHDNWCSACLLRRAQELAQGPHITIEDATGTHVL